jgi:hypothetical protein
MSRRVRVTVAEGAAELRTARGDGPWLSGWRAIYQGLDVARFRIRLESQPTGCSRDAKLVSLLSLGERCLLKRHRERLALGCGSDSNFETAASARMAMDTGGSIDTSFIGPCPFGQFIRSS